VDVRTHCIHSPFKGSKCATTCCGARQVTREKVDLERRLEAEQEYIVSADGFCMIVTLTLLHRSTLMHAANMEIWLPKK